MSDISVPPAVTDDDLLAPVRRALGKDYAPVAGWTLQQLAGGRGLKGGVYRVTGEARSDAGVRSWSLILKIVSAPHGENDEQGVNYWKREFLAYQSNLLLDLPGGIAAPRCFAAIDYPGEATWLWLEDIQGVSGSSWAAADYGRSARHFGRFNGAYPGRRPLPIYPWLNRRLLRKWLAQFDSYIEQMPEALAQPLVQRFCPPSVGGRLLGLWRDRNALLDALEGLPQTFCHHDAFGSNLLISDGDRTVAIDWEFTGLGAVGEELGPLVGGSLAMLVAEAGTADELDEAVFAGYLAGLHDMQWVGNPATVRFAFATSAALRFGVVWGLWLASQLGGTGNGRQAVESFFGQPVEVVIEHFAMVLPWLLNRGDEACYLLSAHDW